MSKLAAERIIYITSQLNEHGIVRLKDMAKDLNVSEATIRRDVDKLEKRGILVKVKGGVANTGTMEALDFLEDELADTVEYSMKEKQSVNKKYKMAVAQYAAGLVKDGECVYIDGGTSLSPLMEYLLKRGANCAGHLEGVPLQPRFPGMYSRQFFGGILLHDGDGYRSNQTGRYADRRCIISAPGFQQAQCARLLPDGSSGRLCRDFMQSCGNCSRAAGKFFDAPDRGLNLVSK